MITPEQWASMDAESQTAAWFSELAQLVAEAVEETQVRSGNSETQVHSGLVTVIARRGAV